MFKTSLEYYFILPHCLQSKENKLNSSWTGYENKGNISSYKKKKESVSERKDRMYKGKWCVLKKKKIFFAVSTAWETKPVHN